MTVRSARTARGSAEASALADATAASLVLDLVHGLGVVRPLRLETHGSVAEDLDHEPVMRVLPLLTDPTHQLRDGGLRHSHDKAAHDEVLRHVERADPM